MKIKCKRCGTEREYKGEKLKLIHKYPQYVSCSNCNTSVKLEEIKTKIEQHGENKNSLEPTTKKKRGKK